MLEAEPSRLRAMLDGSGEDRAYVDAMLRMSWSRTSDPEKRAALEDLLREVRSASLRAHAALRARIGDGSLRGAPLRKRFDDVPLLERDHFVEEVLGIAYPPLDEPTLDPELVAYQPSGYEEIVHAFDLTKLGPDDRLLDLGSGMGKVVLLAALLTGATSTGFDCDGSLVELSSSAAQPLDVAARFARGDAREIATEDADVVFMYIPFTGRVLSMVMDRVMATRCRFVCSTSLDVDRYDLVAVNEAKSWLHVYERRSMARGA